MSVKSMIKASAEQEGEILEKAVKNKKNANEPANQTPSSASASPPAESPPDLKETGSGTRKNSDDKRVSTGKRGRPQLAEGLKRKQYTLTLRESKRDEIMRAAEAEGLSFSKYIEAAVNEYMDKHNQ